MYKKILLIVCVIVVLVMTPPLYIYHAQADMNVITNIYSINNATFSVTLTPEK